MKSVVLCQAFTWLCPECKRRNYTKGHVVDQETLDDFNEKSVGSDIDLVEGDFFMVPSTVNCIKCDEWFLTEE